MLKKCLQLTECNMTPGVSQLTRVEPLEDNVGIVLVVCSKNSEKHLTTFLLLCVSCIEYSAESCLLFSIPL